MYVIVCVLGGGGGGGGVNKRYYMSLCLSSHVNVNVNVCGTSANSMLQLIYTQLHTHNEQAHTSVLHTIIYTQLFSTSGSSRWRSTLNGVCFQNLTRLACCGQLL